ncbi:hypothetical protein OPKNFCMD_5177 [Methylobacterium crusticola]|uniref:Rcc01698-like C-terminal domain-containing protein n=1 Tax=Methylobacterium crusticola TaxID=1697972 RepID=A0ABQ4R4P6_9HYPH|nr:hypothetical protein OPKNFCMD_5177 [Methylobacterium crusticola]
MLDGANVAAVETPSGRWEVLQWAECRLTGPGRYRLTRLLRGQAGSDADATGPVPAGSRFVVLGGALVPLGLAPAARGQPQVLRVGPQARAPTDPSWRRLAFTSEAVAARPLAPVHPRLRRLANGDLRLTWIRRTRLDGDAWEQAEVPLGEEREAYALDILDAGGGVRRTLTLDSPSATYPAAAQQADFGGPVARLSFALHQLSAACGRGAPLRSSLDA